MVPMPMNTVLPTVRGCELFDYLRRLHTSKCLHISFCQSKWNKYCGSILNRGSLFKLAFLICCTYCHHTWMLLSKFTNGEKVLERVHDINMLLPTIYAGPEPAFFVCGTAMHDDLVSMLVWRGWVWGYVPPPTRSVEA